MGDLGVVARSSAPGVVAVMEDRFASMVLLRAEKLDRVLSGGEVAVPGSTVDSRDMPGSCLLPETAAASTISSSWFFLYAAEPTPRSAVCLNHAGSLLPNDCAICVRETGRSGEEGAESSSKDVVSVRCAVGDTTDTGRRMLPDCGLRCCHDSVPDRRNAAALGAGFFGSASSRARSGEPVRRWRESSRADS